MSIYAPSSEGFQQILRVCRASVANPHWFATPVQVEEDERSMSIVFHVPRTHAIVRVEASDSSLVLWGGHDAVRICSVGQLIEPTTLETVRSNDLLRVRIGKKQPASTSRDPAHSGIHSSTNSRERHLNP